MDTRRGHHYGHSSAVSLGHRTDRQRLSLLPFRDDNRLPTASDTPEGVKMLVNWARVNASATEERSHPYTLRQRIQRGDIDDLERAQILLNSILAGILQDLPGNRYHPSTARDAEAFLVDILELRDLVTSNARHRGVGPATPTVARLNALIDKWAAANGYGHYRLPEGRDHLYMPYLAEDARLWDRNRAEAEYVQRVKRTSDDCSKEFGDDEWMNWETHHIIACICALRNYGICGIIALPLKFFSTRTAIGASFAHYRHHERMATGLRNGRPTELDDYDEALCNICTESWLGNYFKSDFARDVILEAWAYVAGAIAIAE
jgi:hypothetical protein